MDLCNEKFKAMYFGRLNVRHKFVAHSHKENKNVTLVVMITD